MTALVTAVVEISRSGNSLRKLMNYFLFIYLQPRRRRSRIRFILNHTNTTVHKYGEAFYTFRYEECGVVVETQEVPCTCIKIFI
jgi:hypothetical protein